MVPYDESDGANHYQRCWCFTWFASALPDGFPSGAGLDERRTFMQAQMASWPDHEFLFAGWESCPSTGRPHYQGYVHFSKKCRKSSLNPLSGGKVAWFASKGDYQSNWDYCTKNDGAPFVSGELPETVHAGEREQRVWDEAWKSAQGGDLEQVRADIRVRYYPALRTIERDFQPKPSNLSDYCNEWIYGDTGSGKSTLARSENPDCYPKNTNKWFCGYQGEETILVEDVDPDSAKMLARYIKIWCDKFPFMAEMKGSSRQLRPKKFVFTSQYQIEECFLDPRDAAAIRRRMKVRKMVNYVEVQDTFNEQAPTGTVGNFVTPPAPKRVKFSPEVNAKGQMKVVDLILGTQPLEESDDEDEVEIVNHSVNVDDWHPK